MIVSVDTARMNKIKYIDLENMLCCVEGGAVGLDFEQALNEKGLTLGHEPDSWEFSTVGGWIATRASGMKKNVYGNLEELVQNIRIVTSIGTFSKSGEWPRITNGPDFNHIFMGSEGNIGIVTEVVFKIAKFPEVRKYGSVIFPNFENGIKFMYDVAMSKIWPASCRVVDNVQFQCSIAMKL
jgi:alkyldihydroxyacetonephosphate synthase